MRVEVVLFVGNQTDRNGQPAFCAAFHFLLNTTRSSISFITVFLLFFLIRTVRKAVKFIREDPKRRLPQLTRLSLFTHAFVWCL